MAWQKHEGTKHSPECTRVFGRYDFACPRCRELISGDKAREGWGRKRDGYPTIEEIRAHDCRKSGCGPVCTFGDW